MGIHHAGQDPYTQASFTALFHQYKNLVFRTAFLLLNSEQEAEDALQEIFLRVYKALPSFDPTKGAFTTWLYRITVNYCRSRRRRHVLPTFPLENARPSDLANVSECVERAENEDIVLRAMAQLSDDLRTVLVLRYYLDLSYREIADVLNIPEGTVKSRLDRAVKTLRGELKASCPRISLQEADQ